jgi:two-component system OmpR family response regulator
MIRVLVIEDEPDLREDLIFGLRHEGFEVSSLADGQGLDLLLEDCPVDVILLDLGLPGEDGLSIARRLHQTHPHLGIIMLTGRSTLPDRVVGLESGADLYLTKTTERAELVAGIRAVARRVAMVPEPKAAWILNPQNLSIRTGTGIEIDLTRQECQLLTVFAKSYGGEASRRHLIEGLGEEFLLFDQRRLETMISRLRRKLTSASGIENVIRSIRGDGYLFALPLR